MYNGHLQASITGISCAFDQVRTYFGYLCIDFDREDKSMYNLRFSRFQMQFHRTGGEKSP